LAAVCAAPDDDAPRLVLADWLDIDGPPACRDPARAEFIRVQVELAKGPPGLKCSSLAPTAGGFLDVMPLPGQPQPADGERVEVCCQCSDKSDAPWAVGGGIVDGPASIGGLRLQFWRKLAKWEPEGRLRARELDLAWGEAGGLREWSGLKQPWGVGLKEHVPQVPVALFRRGFVASVTCTAADWLATGDALSWSPEQTEPCPECKGSQTILRLSSEWVRDGIGGPTAHNCTARAASPARARRRPSR
jgi:uncharacterized protein (TIGR02996 family)